MPYTPRRTRGKKPFSPSTPVRVKGLFKEGQWYCDCEPRLPAIRFETKKKGPNQGRWFFTCQLQGKAKCDFFLWQDLAQAREKDTLLRDSRSEPATPATSRSRRPISPPPPAAAVPTTPTPAPRQKVFKGIPPSTASRAPTLFDHAFDDSSTDSESDYPHAQPSTPPPSTKRKRPADPDEFSDMDSETERALVALSEDRQGRAEPKSLSQELATATTPVSARSSSTMAASGSLPTPVSIPRNRLLIASEAAAAAAEQEERAAKRVRFDSPGATTTTTVADPEEDHIADKVMGLLARQPLSAAVRASVRAELERHELLVAGLRRGRERTRAALAGREAAAGEAQGRITELQGRVVELENGLKMARQRQRGIREFIK